MRTEEEVREAVSSLQRAADLGDRDRVQMVTDVLHWVLVEDNSGFEVWLSSLGIIQSMAETLDRTLDYSEGEHPPFAEGAYDSYLEAFRGETYAI